MNGYGQNTVPRYARMLPAEQINDSLATLPTAEPRKLAMSRYDFDAQETVYDEVKDFQAIEVTEHLNGNAGKKTVVHCPTTQYCTVQHARAFKPIIEGLTQAGVSDFKYVVRANPERAELQIYTGSESADSVVLGFVVRNSYDGSQILSYGFSKTKKDTYVEIVGYRLACGNGMKIRVPLQDAEIIKRETTTKVMTLFNKALRIRHTESAEARIEEVQYIVEAMALLREPVAAVIAKAQAWTIKDEKHLEMLIETHVGKRKARRVREQFAQEPGESLWDLYNAITNVASHDPDMRLVTSDNLLDKAAEMLMVEVQTP